MLEAEECVVGLRIPTAGTVERAALGPDHLTLFLYTFLYSSNDPIRSLVLFINDLINLN